MPYRVVLSTINDRQRAEELASTLLEERLVACVNVVGPILSLYRWQGGIERDEEYLLIMKTMASHTTALTSRVQELHPYEVPELLMLPVETGIPAYLQWVAASLQGAVISGTSETAHVNTGDRCEHGASSSSS